MAQYLIFKKWKSAEEMDIMYVDKDYFVREAPKNPNIGYNSLNLQQLSSSQGYEQGEEACFWFWFFTWKYAYLYAANLSQKHSS